LGDQHSTNKYCRFQFFVAAILKDEVEGASSCLTSWWSVGPDGRAMHPRRGPAFSKFRERLCPVRPGSISTGDQLASRHACLKRAESDPMANARWRFLISQGPAGQPVAQTMQVMEETSHEPFSRGDVHESRPASGDWLLNMSEQ